jgi:hypothetical protein
MARELREPSIASQPIPVGNLWRCGVTETREPIRLFSPPVNR